MSLLQRVEAAKTAATTPPSRGIPSQPAAPPGTTVSQGPGSPYHVIPVEPGGQPARLTQREEMLRNLRLRLEAEVVAAVLPQMDFGGRTEGKQAVGPIVGGFVDEFIDANGYNVSRTERQLLVDGILHEIEGFGPIQPLLSDPSITEVMVNGPKRVYIERGGRIERVAITFRDDEHVLNVIDRIITPLGRHIDETSPRVDARLPDGSRVNAIIRPLSLIGPVITVRKFGTKFTVDELVRFGTSTPEMFQFLRACVEARLNVFLSGGTGSGKTTTLNVLSSFIPEDERIVTIEDAAELQLSQTHVVSLEARPANLEGLGEITIRDLLRNALHMRPDRIVVGECRAGEALDMIQAMTTGQEGSLSTGHANTPRDMLRRLETMILMAGYELPLRAIREQIASAVDVIVHTARLRDGSRKITSITEILGTEDDDILSQEIFAFVQTGFHNGRVEGELRPTGVRPTFMGIFRTRGISLPEHEFGIPSEEVAGPPSRAGKSRWGLARPVQDAAAAAQAVGQGRTIIAGGMVYVSSVGPVDPETGQVLSGDIREQTRLCLANLRARLDEAGSALDRVVWANWALRDSAEFDAFYEEWMRVFPDDAPVGQGTLLPLSHRRAGFRVSLGVIAAL